MIVAEVIMALLLAVYFGGQSGDTVPYSVGIGILVVVCVFVAGFAWSWGPLGWLVCSPASLSHYPSEAHCSAACCRFSVLLRWQAPHCAWWHCSFLS